MDSKYYPGIKRYIASRIGNLDEAEDLAQSVFLEYYQGGNQEDNSQNPEPYLFGIARNLIARHCRNKSRQPEIISIAAAVEDDCSLKKEKDRADQLKRQQLKEILKNSLKQLPYRDYEAVRLCLSGRSIQEISQKTGIPAPVLYKRYQRALKILRKISLDTLKEDARKH